MSMRTAKVVSLYSVSDFVFGFLTQQKKKGYTVKAIKNDTEDGTKTTNEKQKKKGHENEYEMQ